MYHLTAAGRRRLQLLVSGVTRYFAAVQRVLATRPAGAIG